MARTVPAFGANAAVPSSLLSQLADNQKFVLNGLITKYTGVATGTPVAVGAEADVAGCSVTCTTTGNNAFALVIGVFDFSKSATTGIGEGFCNVDGTDQATLAVLSDGANTISDRMTVSQVWAVSLTAGSHTIKLRAAKAGAATINIQPHTTITVILVDNQ